jgi:hypothetical protein
MRVGFVVTSRRFIRQLDVTEMKVGRLRLGLARQTGS